METERKNIEYNRKLVAYELNFIQCVLTEYDEKKYEWRTKHIFDNIIFWKSEVCETKEEYINFLKEGVDKCCRLFASPWS